MTTTTTERKGTFEKYVVDANLPGIAKHFRMIGVDTAYDPYFTPAQVLFIARTEDRIIITSSNRLIKKKMQEADNVLQFKKNRLESLLREQEERLMDVVKQQQSNQNDTVNNDDDDDGGGCGDNGSSKATSSDQLIFEHEKNKFKPLTLEELQWKIDSLKEEIEDPVLNHKYHYYQVKSRKRKPQLTEVVNALEIQFIPDRLFKYCGKCGHEIRPIPKPQVKDLIDINTYEENEYFGRCTNENCGDITWGTQKGNPSHLESYARAVEFCEEFSWKPNDGIARDVNDDNRNA